MFSSKAKEPVPSLKCRNQVEVKKQLRLVNGVAGNVAVFCKSISEVNHLLYACSLVVAERLGLKKKKAGGRKEKEEPWWKRRIEKKIKEWRKDLSRIDELRRKNWKPTEAERTRMNKLYDLDCKGANEVCALLKSKIFSSSITNKRHSDECHGGHPFEFDVKILSRCFGKPSRRLITEAVLIGELDDNEVMNSKREWSYACLNKV